MRSGSVQWLLLSAFAIVVGDFAFRAWSPALAPEYAVAAMVRPLSWGSDAESSKHLYLRRTWHLTRSPEQAWIQLLGHDEMAVRVNGRLAARTKGGSQRSVAALVTDITPLLHEGKNSIAIHVAQTTLERPPAVAIQAACRFADGSQLSLDAPKDWRANNVYDRRGTFWYETQFDDENWARPAVGGPVAWRGQVELPPRAVTEPRRSYWITPASTEDGTAVLARSFHLAHRPREGWLRVLATGPYRLAINGWIVADDHFGVGVVPPYEAVEQTFDVSTLLRLGGNTISLAVTTAGEAPRLRADLEATTSRQERIYLATNDDWRSRPGNLPDWHLASPDAIAQWQPCQAETGYLGIVPRRIMRELQELRLPMALRLVRWATFIGLIAVAGIVAWSGCSLVAKLISPPINESDRGVFAALPYVALVPTIVIASAVWLLQWDAAWSAQDVYHPAWLGALVLLVVMQWLLLVVFAPKGVATSSRAVSTQSTTSRWQQLAIAASWLIIVGIALWLRVRDIRAEPIHHDEISAYAFTQGVLKHGFPGGQVHPDLPFGYCSTSELAYYPTALCALFVDDPRLVLRIPAVAWSMATLLLIGYVGSRWFNASVGLVAAVLYALSPHVIGWANLGRYLSQVQFFTLLTAYFAYEAFRQPTVRRGMVWATAISMSAMYLSWEGAGMFGIGLFLAVLILRRNDLRPVISCPTVYVACALVLIVVAGQNAHRIFQQTQRLWYGEGISDLALKPMWRYPFFDIDFFLMNSSWIRDALLPMIGFAAACFLAVKHRWRFPLRFAIVSLLTNASLMALLLPLRTNRYSYHLVPILVLISAAAAVAGAEILWCLVRDLRMPLSYRLYVRSVAVIATIALVGMASGHLVRTPKLDNFRVAAHDARQLRYPHWDGPTQYLRDHVQEGDIVIATFPHTQNFLWAQADSDFHHQRKVDYWLESTLIIQATIGDTLDLPRDRRSGSVMVYDVEQLKQLFSEHDRIWYCTVRFGQSRINDRGVSKFLRENMDVAYEDFATAVLLRDNNHRTAPIRVEEEQAGQMASEFFLQ